MAVDRISFRVDTGEILGFLGPNGAGKTTTLKMLVGLLVPQGGRISILGEDIVKKRAEVQSHIGVCFEEKSLYEDMSAAANLKFFASLFGIKDLDTANLLQRVGLSDDRKDKVSNYSKGMKQRLMVARALVNKPKVLFLDEPYSGLDPHAVDILDGLLDDIRADHTFVAVSHDLAKGLELCSHALIMAKGTVVFYAPREEIDETAFARLYRDTVGLGVA